MGRYGYKYICDYHLLLSHCMELAMKHSRHPTRGLGSSVRRPAWEYRSSYGILPQNLSLISPRCGLITNSQVSQVLYYVHLSLSTFHNQSIYLTLHFGFRAHNMMNMIDRCPSVFWLKWKLRAVAYWQWTLPSIHCLKGIGKPNLPALLASFALSHSVPKGNAHPNCLHFGRRQLIITFHIQFSIHSNLLSASLAINYWISLINVNTDHEHFSVLI